MNAEQAAAYLGISRKTLYKWKRQAHANRGYLIFSGNAVEFRYRQTGACGQGRISFEREWLDNLKAAMEGRYQSPVPERRRKRTHVSVPLGLPPS